MSKQANTDSLLKADAENTTAWANMANEGNVKNVPMGPNSSPATYKAKTYLPNASKWANNQKKLEEEASAARSNVSNSLSQSNLNDIERNKRSYDRYRERMGLSPRPNKTPSRELRRRSAEKRRTRHRRSRSPSSRRSQSPKRRYGVGRKYVPAIEPGSRRKRSGSPKRHRRRSPSPRRRSPSPRRRSPSPRRRSPSPRRRSPSVNEFGRNMTRNYRRKQSPSRHRRRYSRNTSPIRYTVTQNGRTVNEFGRNMHQGYSSRRAVGPRFFNEKTKTYKRPIHVFNEKTKTYQPANWNV